MSMGEYLRQQLDFFRTRPAKDRVSDDKYIASLLVSQWLNRVPDDTETQQCSELAPIRMAGIHETVERILAECSVSGYRFICI
ncbi:hypothetical protein SAMN05660742_10143 [Propionispira arboris]|uniref:Uncharacterized protein n=1 Tax=Propionispira arboris TaxID=84035 RepID=A0A1H6TKC4_9FIRM|nr:hypothetical protein SAMN05660742_10143 [Propionispira arboris]